MLEKRFLNLIAKYSDDTIFNKECWEEIVAQYSSQSRHYHNLDHIQNMLVELDGIKHEVEDIDALTFSIYYHDIIYHATKSDNELQSALVFKKRISKTKYSAIDKCYQQILATKAHEKSPDADTNILLDIDLLILGKDETTYFKYADSIRKEYSIYPIFLYRKGRKKVLKKMLELETIYKTVYFINKYEAKARANINKELVRLVGIN